MSLTQALCPHKAKLLDEYVAALSKYDTDVHEYSDMLRAGLNGNSLEIVRKRMLESQKWSAEARKRYAAHLEEHRCDFDFS